MNICGSVSLLALIFICAFCAQLNPRDYLLTYGYFEELDENFILENQSFKDMKNAILKFQSFNGLPRTGIIDEITKNKMRAPRCGVADILPNEYRVESSWPMHNFTWKISKYSQTSKLSPNQQGLAIKQAVKRWADVTPLSIRETKYNPTLDVRFERLFHSYHYPFDGKGGAVAHASFPPGHYVHFDDDENWITGTIGGLDLETVAAHEFGHALGLQHSDEPKSLMAPFYQTFPANFKLHPDDVAGIQSIYGKNSINFCNQSYESIDAVIRINESDFVFVDNGDVIDGRNGKKMAVQSLFPGGPDWVEAAVYSKDFHRAYLFKYDRLWSYTIGYGGQFSLENNSPKLISNNDIYSPECAMRYNSMYEHILLLKNGYAFSFVPYFDIISPSSRVHANEFFQNIPRKIDAAISDDHEINFIVGKKSYTMLNNHRVVSRQSQPTNIVFQKCYT